MPEGLHAEAQYRPGVDPFQYPLIEVFLHNRTDKPIEWKRAFLNGYEVQMLTNGVVWFQFYPTEKAAPNQTVELQINLKANPMTPQIVEAETQDGQRAKVTLPPFSVPRHRIEAVTFSWEFQKAYVAYSIVGASQISAEGLAPVSIAVNAAELKARMRVMDVPRERREIRGRVKTLNSTTDEARPGMLAITLSRAAFLGQPVHLRTAWADGATAQCLLRAHKGIAPIA